MELHPIGSFREAEYQTQMIFEGLLIRWTCLASFSVHVESSNGQWLDPAIRPGSTQQGHHQSGGLAGAKQRNAVSTRGSCGLMIHSGSVGIFRGRVLLRKGACALGRTSHSQTLWPCSSGGGADGWPPTGGFPGATGDSASPPVRRDQ